ncbi:nuclear transport factor 2 family protein [Pelagicoccus mobilis]|uniref:Nuclear transport factor 2 family protein n=1 Tax=Pelagicoccus mobilis TaxID=415221 RepID=A0A934S4A7_9BACT|nr:nuclear transport factor 2 family protein [Pelagicoccus mobilis]MBK1878763.1 nuclear transport factor 2 family protein [Pelagicoccus mobilis]
METLKVNFEKLRKSHWTAEESANAELITDFVQKLMNDHAFDYVRDHYSNSSYTQHNRNIPEGIEGLIGLLKDFTKQFPEYCYDVKQIIADGDRVIFHSHATMRKAHRGNDRKGLNIIDIWRIRDGEIVEHWDSLQALDGFMRFYSLMNGGKIRNSNGVF